MPVLEALRERGDGAPLAIFDPDARCFLGGEEVVEGAEGRDRVLGVEPARVVQRHDRALRRDGVDAPRIERERDRLAGLWAGGADPRRSAEELREEEGVERAPGMERAPVHLEGMRGRLEREAAEGDDATLLVALDRPLLETGGDLLEREAPPLLEILRPDRLSFAEKAVERKRPALIARVEVGLGGHELDGLRRDVEGMHLLADSPLSRLCHGLLLSAC